MYERRNQQCGFIACISYVIFWLLLLLCGKIQILTQSTLVANIPYFIAFIVTITCIHRKENSYKSLGFTTKNIRIDLWIAISILIICIVIKSFLSFYSAGSFCVELLWQIPYYLFYIATIEEILFRGFLQSYLFGLNLNSKLIYCIGAFFFSLQHLPYQMYTQGYASLLKYAVWSFPNLIFTFFFHLVMCMIVKKRGNIIIPIAIHFVFDIM